MAYNFDNVNRQFPRPNEVFYLLKFKKPVFNRKQRRLNSATSIEDLKQIGKKRTPKPVFDYVEGAADFETTAKENLSAFESARFVPEILFSVADADTGAQVLGKTISFPLIFAPTGFTRMMNHEGEIAVARVAARNGIPYTLSTLGTTDITTLCKAVPSGDNWFQLYFTNNMEINESLLNKAKNAGVTTLVLTTDCAVGGFRPRDVKNGLTIPPSITFKSFLNMIKHPSWWLNKISTPPIEFASVRDFPGTNMEVAKLLFDPNLNYEGLKWLRKNWQGKLLVKGILHPEDAKRVIKLGADGIVVSNHGGRQLDRTPATLDVLPEIRKAVGKKPTVIVDGGIQHGQDIIAAIAAGADAVMIGRAYLYGLMAGGESGVARAIEIMRAEYLRGLQLVGLNSTKKILARHVTRNGKEIR